MFGWFKMTLISHLFLKKKNYVKVWISAQICDNTAFRKYLLGIYYVHLGDYLLPY